MNGRLQSFRIRSDWTREGVRVTYDTLLSMLYMVVETEATRER